LVPVLVAVSLLIALCAGAAPAPTGYKPEIEPYVAWLQSATRLDPVDYVMGLFDRYDIVILCERDHRDMTQYELFFRIVRDPRFIDTVGTVFTEIGSASNNPAVDAFLKSGETNVSALQRQLLGIWRDLTWSPYWEKYNFYDFLWRLHFLNNTLPDERKVSLYFTDLSVNWKTITKQQYKYVFTPLLAGRDRKMAESILERIAEIEKSSSPRRKYLVIMNYRHAFKNFNNSDNVGEYVYAKYPGRTANVMINSLTPLPGSDDKSDVRAPVVEGKWDAAFRYLGNPGMGFDFAGTPFGNDRFDYFTFVQHTKTYADVFNGFVFYRPLEDHLLQWNIPGFVDRAFLPSLKGRIAIATDFRYPFGFTLRDYEREYNEPRSVRYPDLERYDQLIGRWLVY
jgi:hypothetical protein